MNSRRNAYIVPVIATLGLALGFAGMNWLTGTLGVSAVTANAIVKAVEVGSWGMFLVSIATTGGLVGAAAWGAVKFWIKKKGKAVAIA